MNKREEVDREIEEDELCANCGTDLKWWMKKGKKVYVDDSDTLFCSVNCFKDYYLATLKTVKVVKQMKKYKVWFEQINAQMIEVEAKSIMKAREKAGREWKVDNTIPPMDQDVKEV